MINLLMLFGVSIGCILLAFFITNWETVKAEYSTWPDSARTAVMVIGTLSLAGVCMRILDYVNP